MRQSPRFTLYRNFRYARSTDIIRPAWLARFVPESEVRYRENPSLARMAKDAALDECGETGKSLPQYRRGVCRWVRAAGILFIGNRCMMQSIIRYLVKAALQSVTLAIVALPGVAHAQSGSTGGSIGNVDKSVSGTREAPRAVEPSKPARRSKPEAEEPRHASRSSGGVGGGGNFDGAWAVVSVGCGGTVNGAIVITSGRILGEGLSGHVSPNGSAAAAGAGGGVSWTSSGRFSSRSGAGSYRRSDGCVGSWTASKQ